MHPVAQGGNAGDGVSRRGPAAVPRAIHTFRPYSGTRMAEHFDDRLPDPIPQPKPEGWFEVFCCGTIVLIGIAVIVVVAILAR